MGRMKELYMEMLQLTDGNIPEDATIADLQRMKDLATVVWLEYERERAKQKQSDSK